MLVYSQHSSWHTTLSYHQLMNEAEKRHLESFLTHLQPIIKLVQQWKSSLLKPFLLAAFCGGTEADDSGEQSGQTHLTLGYCWLSNFIPHRLTYCPAFMCLVLQLHWTLSPVCQSCMYLESLQSVWYYSSRRRKAGSFEVDQKWSLQKNSYFI